MSNHNPAFHPTPPHKDKGEFTKRATQLQDTVQAFRLGCTMLQAAHLTGIERASICRYVAILLKKNRIWFIDFGICPMSKHRAGFYTTNYDLYLQLTKPKSNHETGH